MEDGAGPSPSSRRAWVEMSSPTRWAATTAVALLAEGVGRNQRAVLGVADVCRSPSSRRAWVEMRPPCKTVRSPLSPSSRRAWVEIRSCPSKSSAGSVALLAEGVGRNWRQGQHCTCRPGVALLAEGVGRNQNCIGILSVLLVALLAEGVGRNCPGPDGDRRPAGRPPRGGRG